MSRRSESIGYILVHDLPWWVSVILAGGSYCFMRFIAPALMQDNAVVAPIMRGLPQVAGLAALLFLACGALSLLRQIMLQGKRGKAGGPAPVPSPLAPTRMPGGESRHESTTPACPVCGSQMLVRVARRGAHVGNEFWGCSRYPACNGLRNH